MTLRQYLLGKIAEEAAEVAQRAIKAQQFGIEEVQADERDNPEGLDNAERLARELDDLWALVRMFQDVEPSLREPSFPAQGEKMRKVRRWLEYAIERGQVEDPNAPCVVCGVRDCPHAVKREPGIRHGNDGDPRVNEP